MIRRLLPILAAILALFGACTASTSGDESNEALDLPSNPGEEQPNFANVPVDLLAELPGQLAIVNGGSVIVVNPNGSEPEVMDGGGYTTSYQPVWGPNGTNLAWVTITDVDTQVKTSAVGVGGEEVIETSMGPLVPVYLQWAPTEESIAYLRQNPSAPNLELGSILPGEAPIPLGAGQPLFYSHSPDGTSVIAHLDARELVLYSDGLTTLIAKTQGTFSAPAWIDNERVLVHLDGALTIINVNDKSVEVIKEAPGATEFVVGPGGVFVAYLAGPPDLMEVQLEEREIVSSLRVLEIETGLEQVVTDLTVGAFEWSPDGSLLSWLEVPDGPIVGKTRWHYWGGGEVAVSPAYTPSATMSNEYLPFFAQFAQSHSAWSSDGAAFAFAGTIGDEDGIWVQMMDPTLDPIRIGFGSSVVWSPNEVVAPAGVSPA